MVAANRAAAINPPIDDTDPIRKFSKPHELAKPSRIPSKREADTEFQYRPHIVDTDIDCGRHFCGRHFCGLLGCNSDFCAVNPGKSHPWTNASAGGNFRRTFRTMVHWWSIRISPGQGMDERLVHMNFPRKRCGPMALKVL